MKKALSLIVLILVLGGILIGFYYKDALLKTYHDFTSNIGQNLQQFKKTDLGNVINELVKNISTPGPLTIGGKENNTVLVAAKITAQTNIQRYNNGGLLPLVENIKLDAAAKAKAEDILQNQYFEHVSLRGVDPGQLVKNYGYDYIVSGENLILGNFKDEAEVVQDWMNSPGHRANILNNRYTDIGVAFVKGTYKNQAVWVGVQEFGLPLAACHNPNNALKTEIDGNKAELDKLSVEIDAKRDEINATSETSPKYNTLVDEYNKLVAEYNQLSQNTKNIIAEYNAEVNTFNQCVAGK